jgi:hypothetical protein
MWLALCLMLHPGAALPHTAPTASVAFAKVQELKRVDFDDCAPSPQETQLDGDIAKLRELRDPGF